MIALISFTRSAAYVAVLDASGFESFAPGGRQGEHGLTRIGIGHRPCEKPTGPEFLEEAADVTRVEAKIARQIGRDESVSMRQLVDHAAFSKRERALKQALIEQPHLPRVEPVESPHRGDLIVGALVHRTLSPVA